MSSKSIYEKNPQLPPRQEYFYIIQHKASGRFYAGSKYAEIGYVHPDQFWNSDHKFPYYTSSKIIKKIRLEEGDEAFFVCFISPRLNDDAREFEAEFLNSINAASSGEWFNLTNGDEKFKSPINFSNEHRENIKISRNLRNATTQETKTKMSIAHTGKVLSDDTKLKISSKMTNKTLSESHKLKIGASQLGKTRKPHSEETKAKMRAAQRARFA